MNTQDFCFWLHGWFEIQNPSVISSIQLDEIRNHLSLALGHAPWHPNMTGSCGASSEDAKAPQRSGAVYTQDLPGGLPNKILYTSKEVYTGGNFSSFTGVSPLKYTCPKCSASFEDLKGLVFHDMFINCQVKEFKFNREYY